MNGNGRHHHHNAHHLNGNAARHGGRNRSSRTDETTPDSSDHSGHSDWVQRFAATRRRPTSTFVELPPTNSALSSDDDYEREVHVLNRCFDDIESFVARLQIAYASRDELERRRKFAGRQQQEAANNKNNKKKTKDGKDHSSNLGGSIVSEQILLQRAQLPPERDFVDILQKFKLSFNLLVR